MTYQGAAWTRVKHGAWVVWDGMEFVGEVCADFLGLNDSQYQWIIDEHRRREADRLRRLRRLKALKAAREAREIDDMEGGAGDGEAPGAAKAPAAAGKEGAEAEEVADEAGDENAPLLGP
jgi:hypothetical protein